MWQHAASCSNSTSHIVNGPKAKRRPQGGSMDPQGSSINHLKQINLHLGIDNPTWHGPKCHDSPHKKARNQNGPPKHAANNVEKQPTPILKLQTLIFIHN